MKGGEQSELGSTILLLFEWRLISLSAYSMVTSLITEETKIALLGILRELLDILLGL